MDSDEQEEHMNKARYGDLKQMLEDAAGRS